MYGKNVVHKKKYYAINFSLTPFLYFSEDGNIKWHKEGRKKKFDTRVSSWQNILFRLHFAREKIKKGGNMFFISWKLFFFSFWRKEEKVFNFSYLKINLKKIWRTFNREKYKSIGHSNCFLIWKLFTSKKNNKITFRHAHNLIILHTPFQLFSE